MYYYLLTYQRDKTSFSFNEPLFLIRLQVQRLLINDIYIFLQVQELRSKIVKNKNSFTSAAKYMSRVGLFCTADKQTVLLPETRTLKRPDIKAINGELVTDGCGMQLQKILI